MDHGDATTQHHDSSWRTAISATVHCLTGCAIGEVLGMVLATWWGWANGPSIALAVVLAFFFGYLLTSTAVLRSGGTLRTAVTVALAADTVSILVMEVVDNLVIVLVPGALHAGLGDLLLTATSLTSRNTSFGFALAHGRTAAELLAAGEKLSEGALTAEAACHLGRRTGVELPIAQAVRAVVAAETSVDAAIDALLTRPLPLTE